MKTLLAVLSVGLFFLACTEELLEHDAIKQIINETGYEVKIEVFGDFGSRYTYDISPFDTLIIEGVCTSGIDTYCEIGWVGTVANSTITFNNERIQKVNGLSNDKDQKAINADPGLGYGYVFETKDGIQVYTYRITESDYEEAELISG